MQDIVIEKEAVHNVIVNSKKDIIIQKELKNTGNINISEPSTPKLELPVNLPINEGISFEEFKQFMFDNFEEFFRNYMKLTFKITEYIDIIHNWHIDYIGFNGLKILKKESFRDIWNMPPGSTKTSIAIALATLYIGLYPNTRICILSSVDKVQKTYAQNIKKILEHESYQQLFPNIKIDEEKTNRVDEFYIKNARGSFQIFSLNSAVTGTSMDFLIIDDPVDFPTFKEQGFKYIQKVNDKVSSLGLRLREQSGLVPVLLIMQRICQDDPTDMFLKSWIRPKWNHVIISAKELQKKYKFHGVEGNIYKYYNNIKFQPYGEIFLKNKDNGWLEDQERKFLGSRAQFEYQFFQESTGTSNTIFSLGLIRRYEYLPSPERQFLKVVSIDAAYGGPGSGSNEGKNDRTCIGVFIVDEDINIYLDKVYYNQYEYQDLKDFILGDDDKLGLLKSENPDIILVENKANGISLLQDLQRFFYGDTLTDELKRKLEKDKFNPIVAVKTPTSKEERARLSNTFIQLGKLYFPSEIPDIYTDLWDPRNNVNAFEEFEKELSTFPDGGSTVHDDGVDMLSQAINHIKKMFTKTPEFSAKESIYFI